MTLLESTRAHLEALVSRAQAEGRAPSLAAGVVRDGALAWWCGRGVRTGVASGRRPDADTQYRIGSITKTFTAALVLRLYESGVLDLNDPVGQHVPEGPFTDATLRDLLAHRAGVPAEPAGSWWERSRGGTYEALARANAGVARVLPEGERYHYANTSFAVLARVAERHYARPWAEAVRDDLLTPLGMGRTTYDSQAPHAQGYSVEALTGLLTAEPHQDTGAMAPAGQLWSTLDDLAIWGSVLLGGHTDVLSESALSAMTTPHASTPEECLTGAYGLGLRLGRSHGRMLVGHTGSMPGFLAALFVDPESSTGAVVLANAGYGLAPESLAGELIETTLRHEPIVAEEWEPTVAVPDAFREVLGSWHWGNQPYVMSTDGRELRLCAVGARDGLRFEPDDAGTYRGLSGYHTGETMRVVRGPDGTVSHLDIGTFCYTRVPYDPRVDYPGRSDDSAR